MTTTIHKARQSALDLIDGFLPSIKDPLSDTIDIIYHAAVDAKKPAHEAADKDKTIHEQREQIVRVEKRVRELENGADLLAAMATIRSQAAKLQQQDRQLACLRADKDELRRQLKEAKANAKPTTVHEAVDVLMFLLEPENADAYDVVFRTMCAMASVYTLTVTDANIEDDHAAFTRSVAAHMTTAVKAIADDWR